MRTTVRPARSEAADYYFTYIDQVEDGDILTILDEQARTVPELLEEITEDQSLQRYGPDKWSIREVLGHVNDCERLFVFRALWFARGLDEPLQSFDQDVAAAGMMADERSWRSHVEEFAVVRAATLAFFRHLPDDAWARAGVASGFTFSVRALAFITAGHVAHHKRILRERYLGTGD